MRSEQLNNTQPLCPVFGRCGGCSYQNIDYLDELQLKQQKIAGLFAGFSDEIQSRIERIVESPKIYNYRNRIDLKIARTKSNGVVMGFSPGKSENREHQKFGIIPIDACYIAQEAISKKIPYLNRITEELLPSKYRRGNLTVRTGEAGEVFWGGIGKKSLKLDPNQYFYTTINKNKIYYSLDTFFQSNLSILPKLFDVIMSWDLFSNDSVFFDLYGGVGLFSVGLSSFVKEIHLIEESVTSIEMAEYNKKTNQLQNMSIISGKVEDYLETIMRHSESSSKIAMIDPPRCGLSKEASTYLSSLIQLDALMYLSCDPVNLVRDLNIFFFNGWNIEKIVPFDFFPRTHHIETLVLLKPIK